MNVLFVKDALQRGKHSNRIYLRVHTGDKPFECSYCKKKFPHRGHFKVHMMIHTGEHPYKHRIQMLFLQCGF